MEKTQNKPDFQLELLRELDKFGKKFLEQFGKDINEGFQGIVIRYLESHKVL